MKIVQWWSALNHSWIHIGICKGQMVNGSSELMVHENRNSELQITIWSTLYNPDPYRWCANTTLQRYLLFARNIPIISRSGWENALFWIACLIVKILNLTIIMQMVCSIFHLQCWGGNYFLCDCTIYKSNHHFLKCKDSLSRLSLSNLLLLS